MVFDDFQGVLSLKELSRASTKRHEKTREIWELKEVKISFGKSTASNKRAIAQVRRNSARAAAQEAETWRAIAQESRYSART